MSTGPCLAGLPAELFDDVCSHLSQHTLTLLARTDKALKSKIQNPLYYHARVRGFACLALFMRTLSECAAYDRRGDVISKNVHDLSIILDPKKEEGNRVTAVVLGRMVSSIARYCSRIRMRLELENASCSGQPITSFFQESFPRITSLVLHTGPGPRAPAPSQFPGTRPVVMNNARQHMNAPTRSLNTGGCSPNEGFWTGIFNGTSFPHLEEVEIHHVPMDIQGWGAPKLAPSDLRGLRNITRLAVSEAPELNGDVMMSALQCAPNLKHLELKNINGLDYEVISKLLVFALPNLIHFTLHIPYLLRSAAISHNALQHQDPFRPCDPTSDTIHLCPLIRKHGASTPHLDLFLPFLCRDLFLSTTERIKLREAGVNHSIAGRSGEKRLEVFDAVTTRAIINEHRCAQKELRFQAAVRQNVAENPRVISLAEYDEEQKLLLRKRTILRERWSRRIRSSKRLCRNYESWEELCVVAGLGEPGIEWTLGHERLNLGATYVAGAVSIEKSYDELFPAAPGSEDERRIGLWRGPVERREHGYGHDHNDDY